MGTSIVGRTLAVAAACGALAIGAGAQQPPKEPGIDRLTLAFSDPSRAGMLEVDLVIGNIIVKGTNRKDVLVESRSYGQGGRERRREPPEEPPPGLRRLTQGGSFAVEEERNVITVDAPPTHRRDFTIEVPMRTNLELNAVEGTIIIDGVQGDMEIESVNGAVTLTNVGGSVVANTVNGRLVADIRSVTPQKPMAFTSLNGTVDVTLPASVKANLKLRSDQGEVYTDFDVQLRPDSDPDDPNPNPSSRRSGRRIEVDKSVFGSVNGGGPEFEMRTFNGNVYVRKGK
jgi:hypothetical protein